MRVWRLIVCQLAVVLLQSLIGLFEPLKTVLTSRILSWWKWLFQSLCMGGGGNLRYPNFPYCFTLKSTNLTQSRLANSEELHLTLSTVLVPVIGQVKLGWGVLVFDVLGNLREQVAGYV